MERGAAILAMAGTSLAFFALLAEGRVAAGIALGMLAVATAIRRDVASRPWALCGLGWAVVALVQPQIFRADFTGYYAYARSALFDGDLDFSNEIAAWGRRVEYRTPTGLAYNQYTPGPGLVWAPFVAIAHLYVLLGRALGLVTHAADGYSAPYVMAAAAGTVAVAAAGSWALARTLRTRHSPSVSWLAVAGAALTSPVLFYIFVHPGMAHGIAFGAAALLLAATEAAGAEPSRRRWVFVGLLLGFLSTVRLQAGVLAIVPVVIGIEAFWRRRVPVSWLGAGVLASIIAFLPQMAAWKILYGTFFRIPEGPGLGKVGGGGGGWFDPTSPRWLDVLIHADHGLLTWTPFALLGIVGLMFAWRRWTTLATAGILALALTTYVNGCLGDWAGSDAFGARRFDVVVPFLAIGFAVILDALRARPLVAPALLMAIAIAWNAGLSRLYRMGGVVDALPIEDAAQRQAGQFRHGIESIAERVGGSRGRGLAYKALVGRYFYWNAYLSGTIDVARSDALLVGDWSRPQNSQGDANFRWALFPRSCLRIPLEHPSSALRAVVTARAPGRLSPQPMTVRWNDSVVASVSLTREWQDVPFVLAPETSISGENVLCFEFLRGLPGGDGEAAAISRVQLP